MPLSKTAQWVAEQTTSRWWAQDLAGQQHMMLQSYLLLIFLIIGGFCFIQGPTDYLLSNLWALAALALLCWPGGLDPPQSCPPLWHNRFGFGPLVPFLLP